MHFYQQERIAIFIDGANTYTATRALGFSVDYRRLLAHFQSMGRLVRVYYYTAIADHEDEFSGLRPLTDWLAYNGFAVVTKPTKEYMDPSGRPKIKGNIDVELAVGALQLADYFDHAVLFTGDGDFCRLVDALQAKGKRVSVVSTLEVKPSVVSDELRRQADQFIDLADIERDIGRKVLPAARA